MNYRRVLLIAEFGGDVRAAAATIRQVAPAAERLIVVARLPAREVSWLAHAAPADQNAAATAAVGALREATEGVARTVEVKLAPELDVETLAGIAAEADVDLLAAGTLSRGTASILSELRKRRSVAVLWTADAPKDDRPIREVLCLALGSRARAAVAVFLRHHGAPDLHATVVTPETGVPGDLSAVLGVLGIGSRVNLATPASRPTSPIDLLVLARLPRAVLGVAPWPAPVLVLPPLSAPMPPLERGIDVADLVEQGGKLRARITYASGLGRLDPIPDQEVAFVSGGLIVATARTARGDAEIPGGDFSALGVLRVEERNAADPVAAVEFNVAVIRSSARSLVLFDSDLADDDLSRLRGLGGPDAPELLAVRMRPTRSCASIRARLSRAGISPRVIDASAVLDEGAALDVPEAVDAVRLARVAARLRGAAGFLVAAIVPHGPHPPRTIGFTALRPDQVASLPGVRVDQPASSRTLAARLDATTGAPPISGNRIELEVDNATARRWLLEAIEAARERIHLQVYMALDDDVGSRVEAALAAAGARGVRVRVVVDSLHGLEGSLGLHNPLLERLRARPGVELHLLRPVVGVPSLEDLKQRDHRKLVVVDGALALLGGRNLSHEYYTGWGEVALSSRSSWREVPWLDAGARVHGPAVAELERSFLDAWTEAGGSLFDIVTPPPSGTAQARVVVHHGLRDASTLEAYLALVDAAESHVYAVNGFPLILEIQHALVRAIRRGVRVRTLIGNLTPTHGGTPFGGPWSSARTAATQLMHSRMDDVVAAGGEAYRLAVPEQPGWASGLGVLQPHVHAKVMSVDGRACSVGSANLDITAGYWESELMLIVEDSSITRALEAKLDELIAASTRIDRDDPVWRETAHRRQWMAHWPGVLSI